MDVRGKLVELPIEDALLVLREEHRQRTDSYTTYLAHSGKGDPAEEVGLDALARQEIFSDKLMLRGNCNILYTTS